MFKTKSIYSYKTGVLLLKCREQNDITILFIHVQPYICDLTRINSVSVEADRRKYLMRPLAMSVVIRLFTSLSLQFLMSSFSLVRQHTSIAVVIVEVVRNITSSLNLAWIFEMLFVWWSGLLFASCLSVCSVARWQFVLFVDCRSVMNQKIVSINDIQPGQIVQVSSFCKTWWNRLLNALLSFICPEKHTVFLNHWQKKCWSGRGTIMFCYTEIIVQAAIWSHT